MTLIVDPSTLSPSAWFDADGCTGSSGSYVATWADETTNGYDLAQASTGLQPILYTSFRNGHNAVLFDGLDDYLATSVNTSSILGASGIGTVIAVVSRSGVTGGTKLGIWGAPAAITGYGSSLYIGLDSWPRRVIGEVQASTAAYTASLQAPLDLHASAYSGRWWHVVCWQHDTGNNVLVGIDSLDTSALETSTGGVDVMGTVFRVGMRGTGNYFDGYIAELIAFPTVLTETQRQGVQLYLTNKYAIGYGSNLADEGGVSAAVKIELKLPDPDSTGDIVWTDITSDVRAVDGLRFNYGIDGAGPQDRMAAAGRASFALDNSPLNSGGVTGYYSPESSNVRLGWTIGVPVRISYAYYGTTYYKWLGQITDILPSLDRKHKVVRINAMDYVDELARITLRGVEVATSQRADQAFASIVGNLPRVPDRYLAGEAKDVYPYVFDTARDEDVTVTSELYKLAISDFGFAYLRGDVDGGGTLTFEPRMLRDTVSRWTMTDSDISDMAISYSIDDIINRTLLHIHPRRVGSTDGTAGPEWLFTLGNKPLIKAGGSITINCPYRDPDTDRSMRVGGYAMQTPTSAAYTGTTPAIVGYRLWTGIGETGTNLTTGCVVTPDFGGNTADVTIQNNSTQNGYLTRLNLVGYGLYSFESVIIRSESTASIDSYGAQTVSIDMPYQDDIFTATTAAEQIVAANKDPKTRCRSVTFKPNKSSSLMIQALAREPGDRVTITETVSGLNDDYHIQGIEFDVKAGSWTEITWRLSPASVEASWSTGGWVYSL